MKRLYKKIIFVFLLLFFILFSFLYITPPSEVIKSNYNSFELIERTTNIHNGEKIDYIDSHGSITMAADKGYASIKKERNKNIELESFYDEIGNPVKRYPGCYAFLRELDEKGNTRSIIYLGKDREPILNEENYSKEIRQYDEHNRVRKILYFNTLDKPVETESYGYGQIYEYDKFGRICKKTFIDNQSNPMMSGQGFASVEIYYYSSDDNKNNKVESEFYFDEKGNPQALSLGQYGAYKEYDEYGRAVIIKYLDFDGHEMCISKGYSKVVREYRADNTVETERYYDVDGKPFALSEGQYGMRKTDGKIIYLNKNGQEIINIRNLLYNNSWIVIVLSLILILISMYCDRRMNYLFFVLYIIVIIYLTLLFRENEKTRENSELLWNYKRVFIDKTIRAEILKNIWLFIPLGSIIYNLHHRKILLFCPIILSIIIELIQHFTHTGFSNLDDVISNSLGSVIGFYSGHNLAQITQLNINSHRGKCV